MALTKGSYYSGQGPQIPAAGGDYGAPDAHAATANQQPYRAPTGNTPASEGFAATDNVTVTTLSGKSTGTQAAAQQGFDAAAHRP